MSTVGLMTRNVRKLALVAHVVTSVGWIGAIAAFLVLALGGLNSQDAALVRASYAAMEVIAWWILLPLAVASLVTGLIMSFGTKWGLLRHYWVVTKLVLTLIAVGVLLVKMKPISELGGLARQGPLGVDHVGQEGLSLVLHAVGGILILLANTSLAFYKPAGMTRYGRRKETKQT